MRVIIIEDEQITAEDLKVCINEVRPNYSILKSLTSIKTAIAYLKDQPSIDLIFSDIQLSDGLSFEIFKTIKIDVPVIFCTAYDEYALNAFNANGIAYLLKPFTSQSIATAIEKFEKLTGQQENKLAKLIQFLEQSNSPESNATILIYQGEKIIPVPFDDIALMHLQNGVVKLHTFNQKVHIASESLEEFDRMQRPDFFRANRQFLVNRKAIQNAAKYFNRRLVLHLNISLDEKIIISKDKASTFLDWLAQS